MLAIQLAPFQLQGRQDPSLEPASAGSHPILRRMLELEQAGNRELQRLRRQLAPLPPGLEIPRSGLGQQVALALRLIGSGACRLWCSSARAATTPTPTRRSATPGCSPSWPALWRPWRPAWSVYLIALR